MATEQEGHTPGPWVARRCGELCPDRWNVIALLPTEDGKPQNIRTIDQVLDYGGAAEAEANARLIAAAPDLLKAGKDAEWFLALYAEYVANVPVDEIQRHPYLPDLQDKLQMLRAALAKATGKATT